MKTSKLILLGIAMMLAGCSADEAQREQQGILSFSTSIEDFDGEPLTRTTLEGHAFEAGDYLTQNEVFHQRKFFTHHLV